MASVSLTRVIEKMKLENLTPEIDVKHVKITQPDINRPALQLAGYFEHFDATRLRRYRHFWSLWFADSSCRMLQ